MRPVKHVLIVGGGTAGWLTACFLARTLGAGTAGGMRVTLVESSQIGIIGVGEGSFPSLRGTLSAIGLDERRFLRECGATFKQGIRFVDWVRPPGSPGHDHYFHPFSQPSQRQGAPELLPYWLLGCAPPGLSFAGAVTLQKRVADASHGPKHAGDASFAGPLNYAYHFDAGRVAALLAVHGRSLGVAHLLGNVERVVLDEQGAIESVLTREHGALRADLYVDCTGFRAALIGDALGSPLRPLNDVLFVDRAMAMQVPYAQPDAPIASYTISTAREAGWIWDIGLQERRGIGYVYSSRYTDDTRAEQVLRGYVGAAGDELTPRRLPLPVGYRDVQWIKNCVAVGLSAGFLEPLESSGVGLIEAAAYLVGCLFPYDGDFEPAARHFNGQMRTRYERIVDFVKMHYALTQRTDSPFWIDNAAPSSMPESLRELLGKWRARPPHRLDFVADLEMYPPSSWQYVLYGMEYATNLAPHRAAYPHGQEAAHEFRNIQEVGRRALADLPPHRTLIQQMVAQARDSAAATA